METKKHRFLLSPYNFGLFIFVSAFYVSVFILVEVYCTFPHGPTTSLDYILGCLLLSAVFIAALLRESTGFITIKEEKIILRSFLRKPIIIPFESISHIGIDFGIVNFQRQYYIYIGKTPLPRKYFHNITQLKINASIIKIAYRDDVFNILVQALPKNISKTLRASYSVIRAYKDSE